MNNYTEKILPENGSIPTTSPPTIALLYGPIDNR